MVLRVNAKCTASGKPLEDVIEDEWKAMRLLKSFLDPFLGITKEIEGKKFPTISIIYPLLAKLMDKVSKFSTEGT